MEALQRQITELQDEINLLKASATIPFDVYVAFKDRLKELQDLPTGFTSAPLASITAPSGGTTIDSQARTAIGTIISRLQSLGLIS